MALTPDCWRMGEKPILKIAAQDFGFHTNSHGAERARPTGGGDTFLSKAGDVCRLLRRVRDKLDRPHWNARHRIVPCWSR